MNQSVVVWAL